MYPVAPALQILNPTSAPDARKLARQKIAAQNFSVSVAAATTRMANVSASTVETSSLLLHHTTVIPNAGMGLFSGTRIAMMETPTLAMAALTVWTPTRRA